MKLLFIRHGETDLNKKDLIQGISDKAGINENGRQQIKSLIPYIRKSLVTYIYSSPLIRAIESAQVLSQGLSVPVTVEPSLAERDWGDWSNKKWDDVALTLKSFSTEDSLRKRYTFIPPNGESWEDVEKRSTRLIQELLEEHGAKQNTIVFMTHGGLLRALIPALLKQPRAKSLEYEFANGSLTKLQYKNNRFSPLRINWIPE